MTTSHSLVFELLQPTQFTDCVSTYLHHFVSLINAWRSSWTFASAFGSNYSYSQTTKWNNKIENVFWVEGGRPLQSWICIAQRVTADGAIYCIKDGVWWSQGEYKQSDTCIRHISKITCYWQILIWLVRMSFVFWVDFGSQLQTVAP